MTTFDPADDLLQGLGFSSSEGPGPEVEPDEETGWIRGPDVWWDLRVSWSSSDPKSLADLVRDTNATRSDIDQLTLAKKTYRRVCFGDREMKKRPTNLNGARFNSKIARNHFGSVFKEVVFVNTQLSDAYFRGCTFERCDFRYTYVLRTSFQDCTFIDCDFYRAYFDANNVFTNATFHRVSLDKAWLVGVTGLQYEQLGDNQLAQLSGADSYAAFLENTKGDVQESDSRERAVADAEIETADVFRALSGMWTEQGRLADAGRAYVRCKTLERRYYNPKRRWERSRDRKRRNKPLRPDDKRWMRQGWRWLGLWAARLIAKYGESMWLVAFWLAMLIVVPAAGFSALGVEVEDKCADKGCHSEVHVEAHSFWTTLRYSFERLTDSVSGMHPATSLAAIVGASEVFVGIALLGLLGFTIANRLRNT